MCAPAPKRPRAATWARMSRPRTPISPRGNTVSHLTYIGDATVGKYCNFGCGTVTLQL